MAPQAKNVMAVKASRTTGGISWAPTGSTLPTDASTALDAAFLPMGYVSEEGVQPSRDTSTEKVKAWGGDVVAALLTDDSQSFVFKLIEVVNENVADWLFGTANVTYQSAGASQNTTLAIQDKAHKPETGILCIEGFHGGAKMRVVVPVADATVTDEDDYVDGSATGFELTVEAIKDSTGVRAYRYYELDDATS